MFYNYLLVWCLGFLTSWFIGRSLSSRQALQEGIQEG